MPQAALPRPALPERRPDDAAAERARAKDAAEHHAGLEDPAVPLALPEDRAAVHRRRAEALVDVELAGTEDARRASPQVPEGAQPLPVLAALGGLGRAPGGMRGDPSVEARRQAGGGVRESGLAHEVAALFRVLLHVVELDVSVRSRG